MPRPLLSTYIRDHRFRMIQPFLSRDILDVGCHNAYMVSQLPPLDRYVGLDVNVPMLTLAREQFPQHEFYLCDLEHDALPPNLGERPFSTILLIALLEHLNHPERLIATLSTLLAPNGHLIATTPTPFGHQVHALGAQIGLFYKEAAHDHKCRLNRNDLSQICHNAGLKVKVYRQFQVGCNQLLVATKASATAP